MSIFYFYYILFYAPGLSAREGLIALASQLYIKCTNKDIILFYSTELTKQPNL